MSIENPVIPENNKALFEGNNLLGAYDWFKNPTVMKSMVDAVKDVVGEFSSCDVVKILGIGSGTGILEDAIGRELIKEAYKPKIVISDVEKVFNSNKVTGELGRFPYLDGKSLIFKDSSFQLVIARSVLQYEDTEEKEKDILKEVKRVLTEGGHFIVQASTFETKIESDLLTAIHAVILKHNNGQTKVEVKNMLGDVFNQVTETKSQTEKKLSVTQNDFKKRFGPKRNSYENEQLFEVAEGKFEEKLQKIREIISAVPESQRPSVWLKNDDFGFAIPYTIFDCKK